MVLRFLSVSILAFLLLTPLLKLTSETIEKPIIIVGVDNSSSIIMTKDSSFYRNEFPKRLADLIQQLRKKYQTEVYSFGDKTEKGFRGDYSHKQTDIAAFFSEMEDRYANRNVGAIILASDGIYNRGTDPYYQVGKTPFPLYTIALGDTTFKKDICIKKISCSKNVFLGDKFPVELMIEMDKCKDIHTLVTITNGAQVVFNKEISASSEQTLKKTDLLLDALKTGIQRYQVRVDPVEGEANKVNNNQDFYVEVFDSRVKVAILFNTPHPDITALCQALDGTGRYQVELINSNDRMMSEGKKYDLFIAYQIPSSVSPGNLFPFEKTDRPYLYILGTQTDFNAFNKLETGLTINASKLSFSEAQPLPNNDFSLFTMNDADPKWITGYPPLLAPFGEYETRQLTDVLCYQKIGNSTTKIPLILFARNGEKKTGIIAGENIWRWRLSNFFQRSTFEPFDEIINKIAQYLTVREDKSFFRVKVNQKINENENVVFEAGLYNASYELVNEPEVTLTITDAGQKSFPFVFSKTEKAYYLNAGLFPPGNYTFHAMTRLGNFSYEKNGTFMVIPINVESLNLVADHSLLLRMADSHSGVMVNPLNLNELVRKINVQEEIRSVSFLQKQYIDLIGNPWLFLLILIILTTEWGLRKRSGL